MSKPANYFPHEAPAPVFPHPARPFGSSCQPPRRSGKDWFIGAITDWTARELDVDLSFLPAGDFTLTEWCDGVNANQHAEDYKKATRTVTNGTKLRLSLAEGGGWAARVQPK